MELAAPRVRTFGARSRSALHGRGCRARPVVAPRLWLPERRRDGAPRHAGARTIAVRLERWRPDQYRFASCALVAGSAGRQSMVGNLALEGRPVHRRVACEWRDGTAATRSRARA